MNFSDGVLGYYTGANTMKSYQSQIIEWCRAVQGRP
jgi:hypothetical protein